MQSPQMIQAMKILQLGTLDLQERIEQELVENPMLEEVEPERGEAHGPEEEARDERDPVEREREELSRMLEDLESLQRDYGEGGRAGGDGEEGDRKLQALANAPDVPRTMAEALSEELAFLELSRRKRAIAEFLIFSLDERGYLPEDLESLAAECPVAATAAPDGEAEPPVASADAAERGAQDQQGPPESDGPTAGDDAGAAATGEAPLEGAEAIGEAPGAGDPVTADELRWVLERLRGLIHPALGARDLREALLLQVDHMEGEHPLLRRIVSDHLEDVQANRLPRIARATGQPLEAVLEALEHLRRLDPTPGGEYGESVATTIVPDVVVEEDEGEYVVRLERARLPELRVSPTYRKLLEGAQKGDGTQAWIKQRLESARWFIDAIQQRQSTLERIAVVIFERQRPFLARGHTALQTLRMQEVADAVGVHISTVSRAVSGKYAQTPRGIFPLKFFFSGGTRSETGEVTSQVSIQQRIKDLVAREDRHKPLSDEEIAALLKERDDVQIARRTVSKYRKLLGIPSSSQRRAYD
jgi:RNA polymerase sigma-54 factor